MTPPVANRVSIVMTTVPTREAARLIARELLEQRLIACCQLWPVESMYTWKDTLADETEFCMWLKTTPEQAERVQRRLIGLHPYEVPEVVVWHDLGTSEAYGQWLRTTLSPPVAKP